MLIFQQSKDYALTIADCVNSDSDYLKLHPQAETSQQIIDHLINDTVRAQDYKLYDIIVDDKVIGMAGVELAINVHPFFIKPEFRQKEHVVEAWNTVTSKLKKNFMMSVYLTNTPAVKFYERNGGKLVGNNNDWLVYIFDQGSL